MLGAHAKKIRRGASRTTELEEEEFEANFEGEQGSASVVADPGAYRIERELKEASIEEQLRVRQERTKPLIDKLRVWL